MKIFALLLALSFLPLSVIAAEKADPFNTYRYKAGDKGDWYEWWYYKVVDPVTNEAFFFTYGIVNPGDKTGKKGGTKSLVQAGSFSQKISVEKAFPLTDFSARKDATAVDIAGNTASDKNITGSIVDEQGNPISWNLDIKKNWTFDAMGWAMRVPELSSIYWYPAQAGATMTGTIHFRGRDYDLKDAPAYQDRNWGRKFPEWWSWLVSNNFKNSPGTTLAAGGGKPKIFSAFSLFAGLCIGLHHEGKDYIFRTTDGDNVKFDIRWGKWEITAINKHGQKIEISAFAPQEKFLLLSFTTPRGAMFYDYEALTGDMQVRLYNRDKRTRKWKLTTALETDQAGIEWGSPEPLGLEKIFSTRKSLQ
ncbi:MAG: tocopherol cyclase family protein [Bacteriovoracia bacterium]